VTTYSIVETEIIPEGIKTTAVLCSRLRRRICVWFRGRNWSDKNSTFGHHRDDILLNVILKYVFWWENEIYAAKTPKR